MDNKAELISLLNELEGWFVCDSEITGKQTSVEYVKRIQNARDFLQSQEADHEAIAQAHMAGQAEAGIDPSYSNALVYAERVGAVQSQSAVAEDEPTSHQLHAAYDAHMMHLPYKQSTCHELAADIYRTMRKAAPQPPKAQIPEGWRERVFQLVESAHREGQESATCRTSTNFRWLNSRAKTAVDELLAVDSAAPTEESVGETDAWIDGEKVKFEQAVTGKYGITSLERDEGGEYVVQDTFNAFMFWLIGRAEIAGVKLTAMREGA